MQGQFRKESRSIYGSIKYCNYASKSPAILTDPTTFFIKSGTRTRKITSLEAERLQGFPDNWTKLGVHEGEQYEISESMRFQMIGNAISPPIFKLIAQRLKKQSISLSGVSKSNTMAEETKKPPVAYYGGKQRMLSHILPLIPNHKTYVEPFFGGGAVFFAKEQSEVEIINDKNDNVTNFFEVLKNNYKALCKQIDATLHSRSTQKLASSILYNPKFKNKIKKAWAFWVMCNMSYGSNPAKNAGFAYDRMGSVTKKIRNAKKRFLENYENRMNHVEIENWDALKVIQSRDYKDAFFYIDPPYINTALGVYSGYTEKDYIALLDALTKIEGKFLLSGYPSEILTRYAKKHKWKTKSIDQMLRVTKLKKYSDRKTEVLCANYDFEKHEPMKKTEELSGTYQPKRQGEKSLEHRIIKRFVNLNGKLKSGREIKLFLSYVQRAIKKKQITKQSRHAQHIVKIQSLLITLFGSYNTEKQVNRVKLNASLVKTLMGALAISTATSVSGLGYRNPVIPKDRIMSTVDIMNLKFESLGFDGKWKKLVGDPTPGFTMMVYGRPKMGKSYLSIDLASYLARNHGRVLYIASEEQISAILQKKLNEKKAAHPDFYSVGSIPKDLSGFEFVFIDSVNHYGLSVDELRELKQQNPNVSFIYIFQTTKSGLFRGSNEFQHDVDIVVHIPEKGLAESFGRFNAGGEMQIFKN